MPTLPRIKERASTGSGLLPFHRTIVATRLIHLSFADVERVARICLAQLVDTAFASAEGKDYELVADVPMRRWSRWVRVPVDVEVRSIHHTRPGLSPNCTGRRAGTTSSFQSWTPTCWRGQRRRGTPI